MKRIETIAEAAHFTAVEVGKLNELGDYVLEPAPGMRVPGKVFGGKAAGATGGEFSFQLMAPGAETGFLHRHKRHEELYFILSGRGEFQVDGRVFPVGEGSVVRVAPAGARAVRNNGTEPLAVLCVQYAGATFAAEDAADYEMLETPVTW